ncbi:MAG: efflux RND transporter permease subunit, partial [Cyclobacteriaceae bacterium]
AVQVNIEKGMDPKTATTQAMKEVSAPVVATTLVLVAVFAPVAAISGITGSLYQQFAITVAVSVVFSSMNALSLSPALCSLLLKEPKPAKGLLGRFFKGFNSVFDRSTIGYMKSTNIVARKVSRGVVFLFVLTGLTAVVGNMVPGGFIPEEDMGYFMVNLQLPPASSLQRTDEAVHDIEEILKGVDLIEDVTAVTGFSLLSGAMSPNSAFLFVTLKDWGERGRFATAKAIVDRINKALFFKINQGQAFAFGPPAIPGLGNDTGFSVMIQDRGGNTPEYLAENVNETIQKLNARPEIASAFSTFQASVPQKQITINRDKVLKTGVALSDVYDSFGAFLGGAYVNDFNRFGRLYKAYVQAEPEYRQNEKGLDVFYVKNASGEQVPLSTLVEVQNGTGPDYTNRFNLLRSVEITGAPAEGYSSSQALEAVEEVVSGLPGDLTFSWNAMSYQEKVASGSTTIVFVFSLIFVYLILAAQYESWSLPASILMGTPFAIFGALLFLYLARFISPTFENNIFAQISLVMLIGMAAKNAILIVEFAKIKFEEGMSLYDAAMASAKDRFRPILMTAFSFILGVFPLILATGSGAEARKVMGLALLGGLGIATLLGVFFYPMFFILVGKIFGYEKDRELNKNAAS